jgi:Uma2 family endonuclease
LTLLDLKVRGFLDPRPNLNRKHNSLQDYVLVSADRVAIDLFRKDDRGGWQFISYTLGDTVELESINLNFPIEQLFEGIIFENI